MHCVIKIMFPPFTLVGAFGGRGGRGGGGGVGVGGNKPNMGGKGRGSR